MDDIASGMNQSVLYAMAPAFSSCPSPFCLRTWELLYLGAGVDALEGEVGLTLYAHFRTAESFHLCNFMGNGFMGPEGNHEYSKCTNNIAEPLWVVYFVAGCMAIRHTLSVDEEHQWSVLCTHLVTYCILIDPENSCELGLPPLRWMQQLDVDKSVSQSCWTQLACLQGLYLWKSSNKRQQNDGWVAKPFSELSFAGGTCMPYAICNS